MAIAALDPELTDLALDRLRARRSVKWSRFGPDVLPAWVAEMDFPLAPPVSAALAEAVGRDDTGYADPAAAGLAAALAGFLDRRHGWEIDTGQVIATGEVVAGLTELLRTLLAPGDGVIVSPPVYHPFFSLVGEAGCGLVEVPLGPGHRLDLDGIDAAFTAGARAILLCNPQNPTGAAAASTELAALAELAAAHEGWVLADEIHAPLALPGARHVPFLLAGLGCAQIVTAGEPARSAAAGLPAGARHCGHLGALAAAAAYRDGDAWLDSVVAVLAHNRELLGALLAELLPDARWAPPAAGYLAWIDLGAYDLGPDPAAPILERGRLALSSGPMFGRGGDGHVRLNAGTSPGLLRVAVERIAATVATTRARR
ncbi:MAG: aminotransferase class I/II-fold pyridoxal phosphate-dependent enzyme [Acidobacteria bacterium]|nr:MAG: aminotransferase class I/II-fold pyridoxal phosphate-dependent enzyme [Acidobacteriota bacterium]